MTLSLSPWDLVLVVVVTAMGTLIAYLEAPRWKAFLLALPLPFTVANLSLGEPMGPSHVLGLLALLLFTHLVRWLHAGLKLPIVPSIVLSAAAYVGIGSLLNRFLPAGPLVYWLSFALVIATGVLLMALLPPRDEPGHRSPLPLPVKILAIVGVVCLLVALKKVLGGFMTIFPLVGTVAAYEARHSLWTVGRALSVVLLNVGAMMGTMWLAQTLGHASVPLSLAAGWVVFLALLVPLHRLGRTGVATRPNRQG